MLASRHPFPEMEHVHITQLGGQVRQHGSHNSAKCQGPHFKKKWKSPGGIFGEGAITIKGFKPGQRPTDPKHPDHKNIECQTHPNHSIRACAAIELTDKVCTQERHRIGNHSHGDSKDQGGLFWPQSEQFHKA